MINSTLLVSIEYPPYGGGAGIVASQLMNDYNNEKERNRKSGDLKLFKGDSLDYTILGRSFGPHITNFRIKKEFGSTKFERYILNDTLSYFWAGLYLSDEDLRRAICIVHGQNFINFAKKSNFLRKLRGYEYAYARVLKLAKAIICVSDYLKDFFVHQFPEYQTKVKRLYCGISPSVYTALEYNARACLTSREKSVDRLRILTVSRITKNKGLARMYKAAEFLHGKGLDFRWDVVGEGDFLKELKALVSHGPIKDKIHIHGYKTRSELNSFYINADCFWLMPVYPEAFGLVYIEAQSYGLSCVASDVGGIKESVNSETGLLTNSDDYNKLYDYFVKCKVGNNTRYLNANFSRLFDSTIFANKLLGEDFE